MMDKFLSDSQIAWRGQTVSYASVRTRLRNSRWLPHVFLIIEVSGAALAFVAGLWFFSVAVTTGQLLFVLSAVVILAAAPISIVSSINGRRDSLRWEDETPASLLRVGLRRAEATLHAIRIGYWGIAVIAVFVAILWIAEAVGLVRGSRNFLIFYTLTSTAICGAYAIYVTWRRRQVLHERAAFQRLLEDMNEPDADG